MKSTLKGRDIRMKRRKHTALAVAFWCVALSVIAKGQITDTEQLKSWYFLQKLATDIEERWNCHSVILFEDRYDPDLTRIAAAANDKTTLFVHEVDTYIQRYYTSSQAKKETPEVFRFRVWKTTIELGTSKARPIEKLSPIFCRAMIP